VFLAQQKMDYFCFGTLMFLSVSIVLLGLQYQKLHFFVSIAISVTRLSTGPPLFVKSVNTTYNNHSSDSWTCLKKNSLLGCINSWWTTLLENCNNWLNITIGTDQNINKDKYSFWVCHTKVVILFFYSEQQGLMLTFFINLVLKYLQIL